MAVVVVVVVMVTATMGVGVVVANGGDDARGRLGSGGGGGAVGELAAGQVSHNRDWGTTVYSVLGHERGNTSTMWNASGHEPVRTALHVSKLQREKLHGMGATRATLVLVFVLSMESGRYRTTLHVVGRYTCVPH